MGPVYLRLTVAAGLVAALLPALPASGAPQTGRSAHPLAGGSRVHRGAHPTDLPRDAERPSMTSAYETQIAASEVENRPRMARGVVTAVTGEAFVPVILAEFPDNRAEADLHSREAIRDMLFQDGYPHGAGSMRDYYQDQSGGLFDVTGEVSPWLTMPSSYGTYVGASNGYQLAEPNDHTLVKDAVRAADAGIDFCRADRNGDSIVDSLFIVHAGSGAEENGYGLWSLMWSLSTPFATQDTCPNGQRAKISGFTIEPEEYASDRYTAPGAPERLISIGVFVHEFGHAIGLPDLYDTDGSSTGGVGSWDVMGLGTWGFDGREPWRPTPLSAWSKMELGWALPKNVASDAPRTSIPSVDGAHSGAFTGIYRLAAGGSASASEYFLVENREQVGWAAGFPQPGLAVWHVDESKRTTANTDNADDSRRLVALVQADGENELGITGLLGRADGGDLFPGSWGVTGLSMATDPSTNYYDGSATGIAVTRIGAPGPNTIADLSVSGSASTPPSAPTDLVALPASDGDVALDWTRSSTAQVSEHLVYRSTASESGFRQVGTVAGDADSYRDASTLPSTTYYYRVRAFDGVESESSNTARVRTNGGIELYGPSLVTVTLGKRVAGNESALAESDGTTMILGSQRKGTRHKLTYQVLLGVPLDGNITPGQILVEIATPRKLSAGLRILDPVTSEWIALGRVVATASAPAFIAIDGANDYVTTTGAIELRLASVRRVRFKHTLDMLRITLN